MIKYNRILVRLFAASAYEVSVFKIWLNLFDYVDVLVKK